MNLIATRFLTDLRGWEMSGVRGVATRRPSIRPILADDRTAGRTNITAGR